MTTLEPVPVRLGRVGRERLKVKFTPVPFSGTLRLRTELFTVSVPLRAPLAVGRKVTLITQEAPLATETQLLVWL